jgi:hypothetical protein
MSAWRRAKRFSAAILIAATVSACTYLTGPPRSERFPQLNRVAILPLERAERSTTALPLDRGDTRPAIEPKGELVVTAQIYAVALEMPRIRLIPDLAVAQALPGVHGATLEERALQLGKALQADGVIYGAVWRFRDRVGSEYGARYPASVAFQLNLIEVASGKRLWQGEFDQTQQPLSSNLLDWWMFWRAGPRWFTGAELARLGIEQLLGYLQQRQE